MVKFLLAAVLAYWGSEFVKRTIAKGKARSEGDLKKRVGRSSIPSEPEPSRRASAARSPRDVLGVSRGATSEEVARRYKTLVAQYHPDKLAKSAPELQELAAQRLREINAAYAAVTREAKG